MRRNDRGAITLFTLIAGLFFIAFLTSILLVGAVKRQSQIEATKQTESIYSKSNTNEIYNSYFGGDVVPIYTFAQLLEMCSGHEIIINEEGGKYFTFSSSAIYILRNDLEGESNGILTLPPVAFTDNGRLEGNSKTIKIRDTSKTEETYYYYNNSNNYAFPLTKEGYSYLGLQLYFDGINNTANGHSNTTTIWKDISGNGNDATITGGTWNTDSLLFDGVDDSADVSFNTDFSPATTVQCTYLLKDANAAFVWSFYNDTTTNYRFAGGYRSGTIYVKNDSGGVKTYGTFDQTNKTAMNTTILKPSENKCTFYRDADSTPGYFNTEGINDNIHATGISFARWNIYHQVKMYRFMVYNRELSREEIEHNYKVDKTRVNF